MKNGAQQAEQLRGAGFTEPEVADWTAGERARLTGAGFNDQEVGAWFGEREPNMVPFRDSFRQNLVAAGASEQAAEAASTMADKGLGLQNEIEQAAVQPEFTPAQRAMIERGYGVTKPDGKPARTFMDALDAGLQISVSGLMARGKAPSMVLPEDAPMAQRIAAGIGTVVGDLPWMAAGALAGGAGGIETGPGAIATAAGGSFALPAGLRATLMDSYRNGAFKNFGDFWDRASGIIWEEAKGWMTGAATGVAGRAAGIGTAGTAFRPIAPTTAEIATMVTVGSALEGHVPKAQDFADAAVLLVGMKGAMGSARYMEKRLQDVYEHTGTHPRDLLELAQKDPTVMQDLAAENRPAPEATTAGTHLQIPRAKEGYLAPAERAVEERFAQQIAADFPRAVEEYAKLPETEGGKIINTDIARELSPDYRASVDSRSALAAAVHEPASWFAKELYARALSAPAQTGEVLFTAGGTGAGKSSALEKLPALTESSDVIYDTNMNTFESARTKIDQALASGREVGIVWTYRDPLEAFTNGTLSRAEKRGRTVRLQSHIETHAGMKASMEALIEHYKDNAKVRFVGVDNSRGAGAAEVVPIEELLKKRYNSREEDYIDAARSAYEEGRISDRVYRATIGEEPPVAEGQGAAPRGKPQQAGGQARGEEVAELSAEELEATAGGAATAPPLLPPVPARPAASPQPTGPQQAVLDRISVGVGQKRAYTLDKFYTDMKDELFPIRRLVDAIRADSTLATSKDPYKLARLTRGVAGKAQQFLEVSPYRFDTYENVGKSFRAIVEPLKDDLDGLRSYLVAKRALELDKRGIETGVPVDEAREVVRGGAKYEAAQKELLEYQDHLVRYLVDAGVLTKEGALAMRDANRDYVPFFRLMDEESKGGAGKGLSVRSPVKRIKGSERRIIDPLESIVKNTYLFTQLAENNAPGMALVDLAGKFAREDLVKKVPAPSKPVEIQAKEVEAFLEQHGLDPAEAEAFTIFRRGYVQPAENEIVVYRDGKREIYEVPREVAATFKALDRESASFLTQVLAIPARTLRAGATLAPDFMLRNFNRDQLSATILSEHGYVPVIDFVRGLAAIAKKDGDFQAWLKSGGANATMISMDRRYLQEHLAELTGKEAGVVRRAWNVVKAPVELLRITSELVENATRVGEFKRGGGGESKAAAQEAGFSAREVTLDFARMGAKTRAVNMITAFWNAQVEGVDRTVRAFKDHPVRTTTKVAAMVTLPSILLWWANHEDPRWKEIPDWERDLFWIVLTKDHIYRIPKPFELGVLFGSVPERLLDKFIDAKPDAGKGIMSSIAKAFLPGVMPTIAAPVLEQMTNHSFFTDRPLIPDNLEKLLPEYQFTPYTSEFTKALGHLVGAVHGPQGDEYFTMKNKSAASPIVIDNYIRGWSGTMGSYAVQLADAALRKAGVLPDPVKPTWTLADYPIVKAFVVRYPSAQAQSIADFNDHYKQSKMVVDTVQFLAKQGEPEAAMREAAVDPLKLFKLDAIHDGLSNAHRALQLIEKNPTFSADEKRQLIDTIYTQMIDMAREGEGVLREVKKELGPRYGKEASKGAADLAAVH